MAERFIIVKAFKGTRSIISTERNEWCTLLPQSVYEQQKMKVTSRRSILRKGLKHSSNAKRVKGFNFELAEQALKSMGYEKTLKDLDKKI